LATISDANPAPSPALRVIAAFKYALRAGEMRTSKDLADRHLDKVTRARSIMAGIRDTTMNTILAEARRLQSRLTERREYEGRDCHYLEHAAGLIREARRALNLKGLEVPFQVMRSTFTCPSCKEEE